MVPGRTIPAGEFKARCLELMDDVSRTGEELVVTKHGKPIVKLVPMRRKAEKSFLGAMRGTATVQGNLIGPFFEDWIIKED